MSATSRLIYISSLSSGFARSFLPQLRLMKFQALECILVVEKDFIPFPKSPDRWLLFVQLLLRIKHHFHGQMEQWYWKIYCGIYRIPLHICTAKQLSNLLSELGSFDYMLLTGIRSILPQSTLDLPQRMAINFHYGPLPAYRGVFPVYWQKKNQEKTFGYCFHQAVAKVDTGGILLQQFLNIRHEKSIAEISQLVLHHAALQVHRLFHEPMVVTTQNETLANYYSWSKYRKECSVLPQDPSAIWLKKCRFSQRLILDEQWVLHADPSEETSLPDGIFRTGWSVQFVLSGRAIPFKRINYLPAVLYFWHLKKSFDK